MSIYFQQKEFSGCNQRVIHGFFGSRGGVSQGVYSTLNCGLGSDDNPANVRANRITALRALGLDQTRLHNVHQIHSAKCVSIHSTKNVESDADALVTDQVGQTLSILTADCTPVLFQGQKHDGQPIIGAAHAGWKGAVAGVLESTIKEMCSLGAVAETIVAAIGPTIGPNSYEVGAEFKAEFIKVSSDYDQFFKQEDRGLFFDLPAFCEHKLKKAGIQQVFLKTLDTFFHEEDFFSYRRATHRKDKDYGRQISLISIC